MNDQPASSSFEVLVRDVLQDLGNRFPMGIWMLTKTVLDDWTILYTHGDAYPVPERTVLRWSDSYCSRMVRGEGPIVAPRSADVPAYAAVPLGRHLTIGAYVGAPVPDERGQPWGTLCAVNPTPVELDEPAVEAAVTLYSRLLGAILQAEEGRRFAEERAELDREAERHTSR